MPQFIPKALWRIVGKPQNQAAAYAGKVGSRPIRRPACRARPARPLPGRRRFRHRPGRRGTARPQCAAGRPASSPARHHHHQGLDAGRNSATSGASVVDLAGRDIGRIAQDQVIKPGRLPPDRQNHPMNKIRTGRKGQVLPGIARRRLHRARRRYRHPFRWHPAFGKTGQKQRARTAAQIQHRGKAAPASVAGQRRCHDRFAVGSRVQRFRRQFKTQRPEFTPAPDPADRLAAGTAASKASNIAAACIVKPSSVSCGSTASVRPSAGPEAAGCPAPRLATPAFLKAARCRNQNVSRLCRGAAHSPPSASRCA